MNLGLYSKGVRVWVRDPEAVWKSAVVLADLTDDKSLLIRIDDSAKDQTLSVPNEADLPPLRNPDILVGKNDLTTLSHLHEPAVLHNLRVRFCQHSVIYTYCGIVLVAINPYQDLPIFGPETIWAYRGRALGDLDPHIFAIAEEAFTQMERLSRDQSIIVSGESGAGKTVSAKFAMRYFATVGGSSTSSETQVERKVLASNPIMEAIGNAKTIRNDNSSRFGKFIQIMFSKRYHIYSASMRTYLLEKSRVVYQAEDERNYHIFYQLCASRHLEHLADLALEHQDSYVYLNQGQCTCIDGVDDAERFLATCESLSLVGIDGHVQSTVFRVLAAVLHLGNVSLVESVSAGEESCLVARDDTSLPLVSRLLAIDHEQIRHWLCRRKIVSSREVFTKPMSKIQASSARDALAKHIYSRLFNWIVDRINLCFISHETAFRFIGILDIYGFETFEVNSFEQFCINYANEKLQQQFNQHVFKLEQEEYVREKIEWTFIDFYDNQPCLDLIEAKLGVLDLLDEECRMPKGSDDSWAQKLYQKCGGRFEHFEKPRLSNTAFIVSHFAARVEYQADGFLEKNRDTVQQEHTDVLLSSLNPIVAGLFETAPSVKLKKPVKLSAPTKPSTANKRTVGQQFRESLAMLMNTLSATTPHYVRCIKPNDQKTAFVFDPARSVQQLRACGVLETIRISAAGYPSRWVCEDFFLRYRVLCHSKDIVRGDIRATCEVILKRFIKDEDRFRFGLTKVFLRAGQVAYLEKLRTGRLRDCALMIQRHVRGWLQRRRYATLRSAGGTLQRFVRGFLARRRVERIRRHRASICLQRHVRGWLSRVRYKRLVRATVCLQALVRGKLARLRCERLRRERAAVTIQKYVRGWLHRLSYALCRQRVVLLQCCVRRMLARRELKARKIQARSLDHQRQLNKGLENKIISMQQRITELTVECTALRRRAVDSEALHSELQQLRQESAALRSQAARAEQLQKQLQQLSQDLDRERCEKVDIVHQMDEMKVNAEKQLEAATTETTLLTEKLTQADLLRQQAEMKTEELVSARVKSERNRLTSEYEEDRLGYQKLVQQNAKLEHRCEQLHKQLQQQQRLEIPTVHRPGSSASGGDVTDVSDSDRITPEMGEIFAGSQLSSEVESGDYESEKDTAVSKQEFSAADQEEKDVDLSLVMKLQARLKVAEESRNELAGRFEMANDSAADDDCHIVYDRIKMQSLEMDNAKLKNDLEKLRSAVAQNSALETMTSQFETVQDELERRREECIHLRAMITNSAVGSPGFVTGGVRQHPCDVTDQEELSMAFETQKQINRQIADELHREKSERVQLLQLEADSRQQLRQLREDSCQQQLKLAELLQQHSAAGKTTAVVQHELVRLAKENLELRGSNDALQIKAAKLKQQLKIYAKRYKDASCVTADKPVECLGMLEYQCKDEEKVIKALITDLRPDVAKEYLTGLPAHIIFMCVRHMDHCDDANKVYSFMSRVVRAVKRMASRHKNDVGMQLLWLVNLCRLLNFMKEFSGDERFQGENSDLQVNQSLRNFDLSEFRYLLNDLAVITYQNLCHILCEMVSKLVVPALLDHQGLPNLPGCSTTSSSSTSSSAAWSGTLGVLGSTVRQLRRTTSNSNQQTEEEAMSQLLAKLRWMKQLMAERGVEPLIAGQVFRQVLHFLCAHALNTLMLRRELCTWSRGLQIRFNLSHLEQWAREQCPPCPDATADDALRPIVQASQLLQSRKLTEDASTLCDSCDRLSSAQIIKLLNMFSPDECEESLTESFMTNIHEYLMTTRPPESFNIVMMDIKHLMAVRFPYSPSSVCWSTFTIPNSLGLSMLRKI